MVDLEEAEEDDFGFEKIGFEDADVNINSLRPACSNESSESESANEAASNEVEAREESCVWLKLEKDEEGFSVSLLDTTADGKGRMYLSLGVQYLFLSSVIVEPWEVVDEVYLLQDDRVRSLSKTRLKVMTIGLLEALGGLAISYTVVAPGLVATTAGMFV